MTSGHQVNPQHQDHIRKVNRKTLISPRKVLANSDKDGIGKINDTSDHPDGVQHTVLKNKQRCKNALAQGLHSHSIPPTTSAEMTPA